MINRIRWGQNWFNNKSPCNKNPSCNKERSLLDKFYPLFLVVYSSNASEIK